MRTGDYYTSLLLDLAVVLFCSLAHPCMLTAACIVLALSIPIQTHENVYLIVPLLGKTGKLLYIMLLLFIIARTAYFTAALALTLLHLPASAPARVLVPVLYCTAKTVLTVRLLEKEKVCTV